MPAAPRPGVPDSAFSRAGGLPLPMEPVHSTPRFSGSQAAPRPGTAIGFQSAARVEERPIAPSVTTAEHPGRGSQQTRAAPGSRQDYSLEIHPDGCLNFSEFLDFARNCGFSDASRVEPIAGFRARPAGGFAFPISDRIPTFCRKIPVRHDRRQRSLGYAAGSRQGMSQRPNRNRRQKQKLCPA